MLPTHSGQTAVVSSILQRTKRELGTFKPVAANFMDAKTRNVQTASGAATDKDPALLKQEANFHNIAMVTD